MYFKEFPQILPLLSSMNLAEVFSTGFNVGIIYRSSILNAVVQNRE